MPYFFERAHYQQQVATICSAEMFLTGCRRSPACLKWKQLAATSHSDEGRNPGAVNDLTREALHNDHMPFTTATLTPGESNQEDPWEIAT